MTDQITDLEPDYPRNQGAGSRTETAYAVEARVNPDSPFGPVQINDQIFDGKWRRVVFDKTTMGVPRCADFRHLTIQANLLSYAAAQAMRWWLHAIEDTDFFSHHTLQTRLIAHRLTSEHHSEATSAHDYVNGRYADDLERSK